MRTADEIAAAFNSLNVLVVGDVMVDARYHGDSSRITNENGTAQPVVNVNSVSYASGGAANTALNVKSLGGNVRLVGVIADDDHGHILEKEWEGPEGVLIKESNGGYSTTLKIRLDGRSFPRMDFETPRLVSVETQHQVGVEVERLAKDWADAIVVSDYGKGAICPVLLEKLRWIADRVHVVIDPKGSLSKYVGSFILKPNSDEAWASEPESETLDMAARAIAKKTWADLVITQGSGGMTVYGPDGVDHIRAIPVRVQDAIGAGDTVSAAIGLCLASGMHLTASAHFANVAAAASVTKEGAHAVTPSDVQKVMEIEHVPMMAAGT